MCSTSLLLLLLFLSAPIMGEISKILSATVGGSVLIPCSLPVPPLRLRWFYWQEEQSNKILFHWDPNGQTLPIADEYKNRIQVFPTEFSSGNISIRLDNVTVRDENKTFWAYVNLMDEKNVTKPSERHCKSTLQVSAPYQHLVLTVNNTANRATCTAHGGYPEPKVSWTGRKKSSSAQLDLQDAETSPQQDPTEETFSVTSSVSVKEFQSVTCIIFNPRTNQTIKGTAEISASAPIISATVGGSVLIPCSLPDPPLRLRWFHWQDQSNNILFDWVPNGQTHPIADEYKNRCQVFPTEFSSGNISIRLDNVAVRDDKKTFWAFVNLMDKKNLNKPSEQCCTFTLQVSDEEPKSYTSLVIGLGVGLSLSIIINIIIILLIVYRNGKHKRGFWNREIPPYERFAEENVPDAQPTLSRQNQYLENIPLRTRNGAETDDNPASGGGGAEHEKIR